MKFLLVLIFFTSKTFGQEIFCDYAIVNSRYACNLTINNPTGFDGFTNIPGVHLDGRTNGDVTLITLFGNSINFPQVICQQFPALAEIQTPWEFSAIQLISENSFRLCANLEVALLRAVSIHQHALVNNLRLHTFYMSHNQQVTFPSELLSSNPALLEFVCEFCSFEDLPANFFERNPLLFTMMLFANLRHIRPEWAQNNGNLQRFLITSNAVAEIPRNSLNSRVLNQIVLQFTPVRSLDFFSINQVDGLTSIFLIGVPIESLDFNIFDRALNLGVFQGISMICTRFSTNDFSGFRLENMAALEPCFAAFDARVLG